ncbi:hypothetical protein M9458_004072, partial [Cirrhinus mrigala]
GYIAIDDVQVSSSVNGSCPAERECTFQGSLCGLKPDPTTDFTWIRTNGELAVGTPSPAADHTLETDKGSRGSVMTDVNQPTFEHGECLMFWYHMNGSDLGSLNIYIQELNGARSQIPMTTLETWQSNGHKSSQPI